MVLPHAERVRGSGLSRPLITNDVWVVYTGSVCYLARVYVYILAHHIVYWLVHWVLRWVQLSLPLRDPFVWYWCVCTAQAAHELVIPFEIGYVNDGEDHHSCRWTPYHGFG